MQHRNLVTLAVGFTIAVGTPSARSEVIFEYSFAASSNSEQTVAAFDLPSAGRLQVTAFNVDVSADGYITIYLHQGARND